jgi:hypothetical protein
VAADFRARRGGHQDDFDVDLSAIIPGSGDSLDQFLSNLLDQYGDVVDKQVNADQNSVRDFINWMIAKIGTETAKARSRDRIDALEIIKDFNATLGPKAFPKVDRFKFAFQVALRIREPKFINQDGMNLCGPNSLLIQYAKDTPVGFALLARSLYETGKGYLDKLEIEPGPEIRGGYSEDIAEADYVLMGSLRNSAAVLLGDGIIRNIALLTKPGMLCEWLTKAGYSDVEDHTYFAVPFYVQPINLITQSSLHGPRPAHLLQGENSLALLQQKLAARHYVVMNAEADLSNLLLCSPRTLTDQRFTPSTPGPSSAMSTHWTWVKSLQIQGASHPKTVDIKFYTWGKSCSINGAPLDEFINRYVGFVSYRSK